MSFDIYNNKPNLVENKILKIYNEKIKKKVTIKEDNIYYIKAKEILLFIWQYVKTHYGFFILITSIIILLYIRYIEVNKKKNKIKKLTSLYGI